MHSASGCLISLGCCLKVLLHIQITSFLFLEWEIPVLAHYIILPALLLVKSSLHKVLSSHIGHWHNFISNMSFISSRTVFMYINWANKGRFRMFLSHNNKILLHSLKNMFKDTHPTFTKSFRLIVQSWLDDWHAVISPLSVLLTISM